MSSSDPNLLEQLLSRLNQAHDSVELDPIQGQFLLDASGGDLDLAIALYWEDSIAHAARDDKVNDNGNGNNASNGTDNRNNHIGAADAEANPKNDTKEDENVTSKSRTSKKRIVSNENRHGHIRSSSSSSNNKKRSASSPSSSSLERRIHDQIIRNIRNTGSSASASATSSSSGKHDSRRNGGIGSSSSATAGSNSSSTSHTNRDIDRDSSRSHRYHNHAQGNKITKTGIAESAASAPTSNESKSNAEHRINHNHPNHNPSLRFISGRERIDQETSVSSAAAASVAGGAENGGGRRNANRRHSNNNISINNNNNNNNIHENPPQVEQPNPQPGAAVDEPVNADLNINANIDANMNIDANANINNPNANDDMDAHNSVNVSDDEAVAVAELLWKKIKSEGMKKRACKVAIRKQLRHLATGTRRSKLRLKHFHDVSAALMKGSGGTSGDDDDDGEEEENDHHEKDDARRRRRRRRHRDKSRSSSSISNQANDMKLKFDMMQNLKEKKRMPFKWIEPDAFIKKTIQTASASTSKRAKWTRQHAQKDDSSTSSSSSCGSSSCGSYHAGKENKEEQHKKHIPEKSGGLNNYSNALLEVNGSSSDLEEKNNDCDVDDDDCDYEDAFAITYHGPITPCKLLWGGGEDDTNDKVKKNGGSKRASGDNDGDDNDDDNSDNDPTNNSDNDVSLSMEDTDGENSSSVVPSGAAAASKDGEDRSKVRFNDDIEVIKGGDGSGGSSGGSSSGEGSGPNKSEKKNDGNIIPENIEQLAFGAIIPRTWLSAGFKLSTCGTGLVLPAPIDTELARLKSIQSVKYPTGTMSMQPPLPPYHCGGLTALISIVTALLYTGACIQGKEVNCNSCKRKLFADLSNQERQNEFPERLADALSALLFIAANESVKYRLGGLEKIEKKLTKKRHKMKKRKYFEVDPYDCDEEGNYIDKDRSSQDRELMKKQEMLHYAKVCSVCRWEEDTNTGELKFPLDQLIDNVENLRFSVTFTNAKDIRSFVWANLRAFMGPGGCALFLETVVHIHGIPRLRSMLDNLRAKDAPEVATRPLIRCRCDEKVKNKWEIALQKRQQQLLTSTSITPHNIDNSPPGHECISTELMSLLITGKTEKNMKNWEATKLGFGLLSVESLLENIESNPKLKSPPKPIWIVKGDSSYSVLWNNDLISGKVNKSLSQSLGQESTPFHLTYWNGWHDTTEKKNQW